MTQQQWEIQIKSNTTSRLIFGVSMRELTIGVAREIGITDAESSNDVDRKCVSVIFDTNEINVEKNKEKAIGYQKAIEVAIKKKLVEEKCLIDDENLVVVDNPVLIKNKKIIKGLNIDEKNYRYEGVWALQGAAKALIAQPKILENIRYDNIMSGIKTELLHILAWTSDVENLTSTRSFHPLCIKTALSEPIGVDNKDKSNKISMLYHTLITIHSSCMEANRVLNTLEPGKPLQGVLTNMMDEIRQNIIDIGNKIPYFKDLKLGGQD